MAGRSDLTVTAPADGAVAELAVHGGDPVRTTPFPAWPRSTERCEQAVLDVLRGGHWWQSGDGYAERLETWLAAEHEVDDCVAVANGTVALELAYLGLGLGQGDEVLVPAITFVSTASALRVVGATPVPVDVRPGTLCLDTEDARRKITARTRAVVPVHLAGQPADLDAVLGLAAEAGLFVIEDSAQAIGARWRGRPVGSFGDAATLSFQAAKLLPGGEGGAVLIRRNAELAERVRLLANCGRPRGDSVYDHTELAGNARISELHSAVLLAQTDDVDELTTRRDVAARSLARTLTETAIAAPVAIDARVTRMPWYMFVFRPSRHVLDRMSTIEYAAALTAEGVPATRLYPAFHRLPAYAGTETARVRCPVAEDVAAATVWLHHRLLLDGQDGVADIVRAIKKIDEFCRPSAH